MANLKNIVYLTDLQYREMLTNGSITVEGVTYTYDPNSLYLTPSPNDQDISDLQADVSQLQQTAARALLTPLVTPTESVIPVIGTNNAQTNVKIGDGLALTNGSLVVDKTGKKYLHKLVPTAAYLNAPQYVLTEAPNIYYISSDPEPVLDISDIPNADAWATGWYIAGQGPNPCPAGKLVNNTTDIYYIFATSNSTTSIHITEFTDDVVSF